MRRVGLFGGSFNPPHQAHRALALQACETLALDELRWLPAGQPWQKPAGELASPEHRLAMVQTLIAGEGRFVVDNRELSRQGPSYTLDTVRELTAEQPGTDWFLVIGQDQYARFATWHGWRELLAAVTLAVAAREGQTVQVPPALAGVPHRCVVLPLPRHDINATDIRARVARGLPIAPLVGEAVARYIDQHSLYRAAPGH
ncbi:nicotinate-nucleotide adenylyltransferase [Ideonella sp. B7]|uniref:nicotinate-nucleotide adenylyltransferase n=1 Tax=Ideonella benzenivorans TaxID=2831643 RepID=UPI001CED13A2|nr:nicotinate-nucleotide adenylyltransferase [Ideonella benzenivorans]MCA6216618.1 nicotinate-nucleotide adenylyltransferase [Ideonella benzenivorans]